MNQCRKDLQRLCAIARIERGAARLTFPNSILGYLPIGGGNVNYD